MPVVLTGYGSGFEANTVEFEEHRRRGLVVELGDTTLMAALEEQEIIVQAYESMPDDEYEKLKEWDSKPQSHHGQNPTPLEQYQEAVANISRDLGALFGPIEPYHLGYIYLGVLGLQTKDNADSEIMTTLQLKRAADDVHLNKNQINFNEGFRSSPIAVSINDIIVAKRAMARLQAVNGLLRSR